MKLQTKFVVYYFPAVVLTIVIFILSALSSGTFKAFNLSDLLALDKVGHCLAYLSLSFFYYFGFIKSKNRKPAFKEILWILFACTLYGILLEFCQLYFFSSRCFEILDMIANATGALLGVIIGFYLVKPKIN